MHSAWSRWAWLVVRVLTSVVTVMLLVNRYWIAGAAVGFAAVVLAYYGMGRKPVDEKQPTF